MSKLSDQIIPQLNSMQKNYLGLLFFNELSQNIVEDIVAQQLSMMPGTKLASVINNLVKQVQKLVFNINLIYILYIYKPQIVLLYQTRFVTQQFHQC
jgi:hypothetical protein